MSRSQTPASDPLLDFCSEEDGTAAEVAAGWRLPNRPRIPEWVLKLKSELAGLPQSDAMTAIAIMSAVAFVAAFALTPRTAATPALTIEAHVLNDIDLTPAGKPVATTGQPAQSASDAPAVKKSREARPAPPGPVAGWVTIAAPADFEIVENGQLIGSTSVPRIMLPVGRHRLEIGSAELGYKESHTVDVVPGRTTTLTVAAPTGRVNINARPWANVAVDGRSLGETPLSDVTLPLGRHTVVFQHPDYGERRETIVVSANGVGHIGVDFVR